MTPKQILDEQNLWIDSLLDEFEAELRAMLSSSQAHVIGRLQRQLSITDGVIDRTPANLRVIRQIDKLMAEAMFRAGYGQLVEEFVSSFNGHFRFFERQLEAISAQLKHPLKPKLRQIDLAVLESQQLNLKAALELIAETAAASVAKRSMFSIGGLGFGDLVEQIAKGYSRSIPEAVNLAESSTMMFYRTLSDQNYKIIEDGLPEGVVRYRFSGPYDNLTRPFCKHILRRTRKRPMTRKQIDTLNNGQLPNVFITGGGYRCRHTWMVDSLKT